MARGFNPDYDDNKKNDYFYLTKIMDHHDGKGRSVELLYDEELCLNEKDNNNILKVPIRIIKEHEVYSSDGGQQKIYCHVVESKEGRYFNALRISRRTEKGVYDNKEITLTFHTAIKVYEFIQSVLFSDKIFESNKRFPLEMKENRFLKINKNDFEFLLNNNLEHIDEYLTITNIRKRENSIKILKQFIDGNYDSEQQITNFFKSNIWLFDSEYSIFSENGKINKSNLADLLPINFELFLDIIEIKLPKVKLFNYDNSHNNYYSSSHLTKAISQVQNYIFELETKNDNESISNSLKIIKPRGLIIIGSNDTMNQDELNYLRILNSSYHNIKIITYQQLLKKAEISLELLKKG